MWSHLSLRQHDSGSVFAKVNEISACSMGICIVTADILAHQVLLNRVPEQATEDSVKYQIYY